MMSLSFHRFPSAGVAQYIDGWIGRSVGLCVGWSVGRSVVLVNASTRPCYDSMGCSGGMQQLRASSVLTLPTKLEKTLLCWSYPLMMSTRQKMYTTFLSLCQCLLDVQKHTKVHTSTYKHRHTQTSRHKQTHKQHYRLPDRLTDFLAERFQQYEKHLMSRITTKILAVCERNRLLVMVHLAPCFFKPPPPTYR